jgi:hypothetical protein
MVVPAVEQNITAANLKEVDVKQDWLFVLEATITMHLQVEMTVNETTILQ